MTSKRSLCQGIRTVWFGRNLRKTVVVTVIVVVVGVLLNFCWLTMVQSTGPTDTDAAHAYFGTDSVRTRWL